MKFLFLISEWLMAASVPAQNFAIDWFTIDGGATSTGGFCSVNGTTGQPDVGDDG